MLNNIKNIFNIEDLRKRIFFTIGLLIVYRLGCHIPTPGIDSQALTNFFDSQAKGTLFGMFDMFSGGALKRASIFALGVMPYINASIIMQLLTAVVPSLEKLSKEGTEGHKKISQYSLYLAIGIAILQSVFMSIGLESLRGPGGMTFVREPGFFFRIISAMTFTAGTMTIVWLGEQITERGIGNGVSIIILSGIIAEMPTVFTNVFALVQTGEIKIFSLILMLIFIIFIVASVVYIEEGYSKIPIQYARRIIGSKTYGGQSTHLPLKVDQSGVIAVIFAATIIIIPGTIAQFAKNPILTKIAGYISPGSVLYAFIYGPLIIFFCFFYTAITFNPVDIAENLKKSGGFIPGIRPGSATAEYIENIMNRITLVGALFVTMICIIPIYIGKYFNLASLFTHFSGTSILILVGVSIDTMKQVESHLLMRHYDGFMKKGKLKASD
ncbi:MAG: preprotein translocase subunit SecY [Candidatus Firestonebacteria bacterium]|nr:preprotein translocase subunit SecY [Candidatus Firestonebacteria bacterium]